MDRTATNSPSALKGVEHKMEESTLIMEPSHEPQCPLLNFLKSSALDSGKYGFLAFAASRPFTPDQESQVSESIFSRSDSMSSVGSNSEETEALGAANAPVSLYSPATGTLLPPSEPSFVEGNSAEECTTFATSRPFTPVVRTRLPTMNANRAARSPTSRTGQSPPKQSFVAKHAKRHQTFPPLGRPSSSSDACQVLASRKNSIPATATFPQSYPFASHESFFDQSIASGSRQPCETRFVIEPIKADTRNTGIPKTPGAVRADNTKVEREPPESAPFSSTQLRNPAVFELVDRSRKPLKHSLPAAQKPDATSQGICQSRLSASLSTNPVKDE